MENNIIVLVVFGLIAVILLVNMIQFITNFFRNRKDYTQREEVVIEINKSIKPNLISLEKKYENANTDGKFGSYVYELFKDKFKGKNEKFVERAICKCCSDYEGADCKEDFCLTESGIKCDKK
jgi:Na+-translocating ferredoxin:NAD+ oxidoreductase RnfG subunit